jgi:NAD(P)-dependent dehydrogenase (short-subunit alcohol dehydrogenase family)
MPKSKTIFITGAGSGMGFHTAKALALRGHTVLAAVRNTTGHRHNIDELNDSCKQMNPAGSVHFVATDLSDLQMVALTVERILPKFPIIDTLICNAGIMNVPWNITSDGYELQFQTNFLAHFYLTYLLQNSLTSSDDPRVINICSASAEKGNICDISKLKKIGRIDKKNYDGMQSYRESKLAQLATVYGFMQVPEWKGISFSIVHPGVVNTPLFYRNYGSWYEAIMKPVVWAGYASGKFKTPAKGAKTAIWLAEAETAKTGYWENNRPRIPNPIVENQDYCREIIEHYKHDLRINE